VGLMDILNGMQNGPRGQRPPAQGGSGGGMSPLVMALLGLLAYKAFRGSSPPQTAPGGAGRPPALPPAGGTNAGASDGGLGDILGSIFGGRPGAAPGGGGLGDILGGLLAGGGAGNILNGGLGNILNDLQRSGQGKVAQSWVGTGPNESISPRDLESALGADTLDELAQRSGMSRSDLAAGLSEQLPDLVDQLTPHGRLPTEQEAARW
jgi:uncharacterized protein YidB (DUF937 family)